MHPARQCQGRGYTWTAYVNGKEDKDVDDNIPTSKDDSTWKYTGKGTVTEIYIDDATPL